MWFLPQPWQIYLSRLVQSPHEHVNFMHPHHTMLHCTGLFLLHSMLLDLALSQRSQSLTTPSMLPRHLSYSPLVVLPSWEGLVYAVVTQTTLFEDFSISVLVLSHLHCLCSSACQIGTIKINLLSCKTVVTQWITSIIIPFSKSLAKDSENQQFYISRTKENSISINKNKTRILSTFFSYLLSNTGWLKPFPFHKLSLSTNLLWC